MTRSKRAREESSRSRKGKEPIQSEPEISDEMRYRIEKISGWKISHERRISLKRIPRNKGFHDVINHLGWGAFTSELAYPCIPLVREFYARLPEGRRYSVTVFGKSVEFGPTEINEALKIPPLPVEEDMYRKLRRKETDITDYEVQHTLSFGRGVKTTKVQPTIKMGSLCGEAKFWRKFMTGRLLGSTKDGETTKEQQYLLFCIVLGFKFDVGQVIYDKIDAMRHAMTGNRFGKMSLSFPSLITLLCWNVPRPEGAGEIKLISDLDDSKLTASDRDISTVREFHKTFWADKDQPDWQQPVMDGSVPRGQPRVDSDDESDDDEDQEQPRGGEQEQRREENASYSVPLSDWTAMRDAMQEQAANNQFMREQFGLLNDRLDTQFGLINGRLDGLCENVDEIRSNQARFYTEYQEQHPQFYPPPQ